MPKKINYLSWDEYFMSICILSSMRSKDPNTQVGACIVDSNNRIVSIGYNGFPNNCSDDCLPWNTSDNYIESKYAYVVHAEVNAILNKSNNNNQNLRLYCTLFPCNECTKIIIQSNIKEIIYLSDENKNTESYKASKIMLDLANIKYYQYNKTNNFININI